jgi:hypothetical protein
VQSAAWSKDLRLSADGTDVVSHVGTALLRMLADRAGQTSTYLDGLCVATGITPAMCVRLDNVGSRYLFRRPNGTVWGGARTAFAA